jgi:hypothetical protein
MALWTATDIDGRLLEFSSAAHATRSEISMLGLRNSNAEWSKLQDHD